MELWIRSQDRELLIQTKIVELEYFGEEAYTSINVRFEGRNASLGRYRTKEKALEVLDEIQNVIISNMCYQEVDGIKLVMNSTVYEMPQE